METRIFKKQKEMSDNTFDTIRPCLGFKFTKREEWLMKKTKRKAAEFMAGYGKGVQPRMIDARHYINTEDIEYKILS